MTADTQRHSGPVRAETEEALRLLRAAGQTVAVAESLTGGLVAAEITAVSGASRAFRGSVTAYATELKHRILGVDATLLDRNGAVDARVAAQMAEGVRRLLGADWGLATTGVAGPEPQDGKAVGTVFVAVAGSVAARRPGPPDSADLPDEGLSGPVTERTLALRLNGDRAEIRTESVRSVLALLREELVRNARAQDTEQNGGT
ncbi:CinA family protein [Streptomyces sp. NPDC007088]|uniref:CinA family protein n=1 Tax=Streptomyces sp. NPDC007088 TaxID=3364773 RepID=UPI0036BDA975